MRIAIIGCGYVLDHYMTTLGRHPELVICGVADRNPARTAAVAKHYGLKVYPTNAALLADPQVEMVLNLTSIESHFEVTRDALLAGKHVYSEKPFTTDLDQARELFALAEARGLRLSGAPCNALSDSVQTMWRALREGAVGQVRVVYAEFDDNPVYLMHPESWRSRSGAPWPHVHEYESGCTWEHGGYYLGWLCTMFGPVQSVTAFSKCTAPDKTDLPLHPADTPDFAVACLSFASGVVARLTLSIVAPFDQRLRIIGDAGELHTSTYRDYNSPVFLERFSQLTLNARKARSVRHNNFVAWLFGVGGQRLPMLHRPGPKLPLKVRLNPVRWLKRRELGQQDKLLGVAEMAEAIRAGRAPMLTPDFILHVTELTLAVQAAGMASPSYRCQTSFAPLPPMPFAGPGVAYHVRKTPRWIDRIADQRLVKMHQH